MTKLELAAKIEQTHLVNDWTREDIIAFCTQAKEAGLSRLCVDPGWVFYIKKNYPDFTVVTVPNWVPGGGLDACRGSYAFEDPDIVDYIWDIRLFGKFQHPEKTAEELAKVRSWTKKPLRIIIETSIIRKLAEHTKTSYELMLKEACKLVEQSGAEWIKTDSGLFKREKPIHLIEDIQYIKQFSKLPVKAAGFISTAEFAVEVLDAGAEIIGASKGVQILKEFQDAEDKQKTDKN